MFKTRKTVRSFITFMAAGVEISCLNGLDQAEAETEKFRLVSTGVIRSRSAMHPEKTEEVCRFELTVCPGLRYEKAEYPNGNTYHLWLTWTGSVCMVTNAGAVNWYISRGVQPRGNSGDDRCLLYFTFTKKWVQLAMKEGFFNPLNLFENATWRSYRPKIQYSEKPPYFIKRMDLYFDEERMRRLYHALGGRKFRLSHVHAPFVEKIPELIFVVTDWQQIGRYSFPKKAVVEYYVPMAPQNKSLRGKLSSIVWDKPLPEEAYLSSQVTCFFETVRPAQECYQPPVPTRGDAIFDFRAATREYPGLYVLHAGQFRYGSPEWKQAVQGMLRVHLNMVKDRLGIASEIELARRSKIFALILVPIAVVLTILLILKGIRRGTKNESQE